MDFLLSFVDQCKAFDDVRENGVGFGKSIAEFFSTCPVMCLR